MKLILRLYFLHLYVSFFENMNENTKITKPNHEIRWDKYGNAVRALILYEGEPNIL